MYIWTMGLWILTAMLLLPLLVSEFSDAMRSSYKAAVYEHVIIFPLESRREVSRAVALKNMYKNLDVYENQAVLAKRQDANILVFPEDGIYGTLLSRDAIYPYLENIPNPEKVTWSPCNDPTRYAASEIQHRLSCMAKRNKMYIAANMGDKITCNKQKDPKCPDDGRYQYNTAVVYDPEGTLVAKYHKRNLFFESQFDKPDVEFSFFDTPFGRFGLAICFDLLFHDPPIALVTRHNVTNILYPTAWMDALPMLSAVGYHSSFARGMGVNLLGSNVHLPLLKFHGSGVYTPNGMAAFYYSNSLLSPGKLVVTEIDVLEQPIDIKRNSTHFNIAVGAKPPNLNKNWRNENEEFFAEVFHDVYKFRALQETRGEINLCYRGVCCHLKYEMESSNIDNLFGDLFAFGVFDGLHSYEGQYYLQVCILLKCANNAITSSCGSTTFESSTMFKSLSIQGEFQTRYVYPQVILSSHGQLELADADKWDFFSNTSSSSSAGHGQEKYKFVMSSSSSGFKNPLLSASLYGRYYTRDNDTATTNQEAYDIFQSSPKKLSNVLSSVLFTLSSWYKSLKMILFRSYF